MAAKSAVLFDAAVLDRSLKTPVHRQLYEFLRAHIAKGHLSAGIRLPATRAVAESLGIGRNTVIAAYDQLLTEGYLETRPGSGTWVADIMRRAHPATQGSENAVFARISRRGAAIAGQPGFRRPLPHKINFHPGYPETETFPFSIWARLLAKHARSRTDDMLDYRQYAGYPRLRESIAEYVGVARGVDCSAAQVIVVTGAQAALDILARTLMDAGELAWMEEPGYFGARTALLASGAQLAPLRVSNHGWAISDPTLPAPRLIFVTPSCQWPLGAIMTLDQRLQLLATAQTCGAWILEDDYDCEYRFRGRAVSALQGLDRSRRVIYVGTFGKTMFSSLRLGFMIVPRELSDVFERTVNITGHFPPLVLQAALADFIQQGYYANHLRKMRSLYAHRQHNFVELCREHLADWMTVTETDSGIQLFGKFVQPFDDREVAAAALALGVDAQPVSVNYYFDTPTHGLLLGYAGLDDDQCLIAVSTLRKSFERLVQTRDRRRSRVARISR
jgi:GntR family transcriptional regulator/MocR family aminotransferase